MNENMFYFHIFNCFRLSVELFCHSKEFRNPLSVSSLLLVLGFYYFSFTLLKIYINATKAVFSSYTWISSLSVTFWRCISFVPCISAFTI